MKKTVLIAILFCTTNLFAQRTEANLKTDLQTGTTTVHIGTDSITGLEMYRRMKTLNSDVHEKQHRISYEEWLVAKDGKVYQDFYTVKTYLVVDKLDAPQNLSYTQWFNQLAPALLPAINQTLLEIPKDAPSNYVTTQ